MHARCAATGRSPSPTSSPALVSSTCCASWRSAACSPRASRSRATSCRAAVVDVGVLLEQHGYALTFLGSLIEGEVVLVLAGLGAHRGYLQLAWVILLGAVGGFLAGQGLFW